MTTLPVIASTLSATALGEFAKEHYGLHKNFNCKLFRTGMNHTYFLSDNESKYVLRVYSHNWRSDSEINEELTFLNLLNENHLSVSIPIPDKNGTLIQEIKAPEGMRYAVLFSFAKGDKIRFMNEETCYAIGSLMANLHKTTLNNTINRITYNKKSLIELPYQYLKQHFSERLPEMEYIKNIGTSFTNKDFENSKKGIVHLDIWYDNMAITKTKEITIFDFDFCGNGSQILDIAYFCNQLFNIESDKKLYETKMQHFLEGYHKTNPLSNNELTLIPKAGLAIFVFYLGVQSQRFDWSNIFLTENYLKMYTNRMKSWTAYNDSNKIGLKNSQI
ncbi:phosphotransferase [Aureibaculum sp. A20]|uniref:Phosphotransferase n=1 Tax=Aureibaculum flavum TaxID=2795986 RepID=A0ABS0WMS8_9FLAO|nr:phosphotransferase [Aureibaculum flavum]MBJ2173280.1 phosphotransferase [Aureibaculum flavum]